VTAVTVIEVPVELPLNAHMLDEEACARRLLAEAAAIGELYGVTVKPLIVRGRAAGDAIVKQAAKAASEIVVLSAPRKERARRNASPFGKTVDVVLKHAPCRVMVAAAPANI
jgi:nucleotide-binding universal stress UspA family protein